MLKEGKKQYCSFHRDGWGEGVKPKTLSKEASKEFMDIMHCLFSVLVIG